MSCNIKTQIKQKTPLILPTELSNVHSGRWVNLSAQNTGVWWWSIIKLLHLSCLVLHFHIDQIAGAAEARDVSRFWAATGWKRLTALATAPTRNRTSCKQERLPFTPSTLFTAVQNANYFVYRRLIITSCSAVFLPPEAIRIIGNWRRICYFVNGWRNNSIVPNSKLKFF